MHQPHPVCFRSGPRRSGLSRCLFGAAVLSGLSLLPVVGASVPAVPPEIVSAWKLNGGNALLIFRHDGTYFHAEADDVQPGMERGFFTWNKVTQALAVTPLRDTNGEIGLSPSSGTTTLAISGNTMTLTGSDGGTYTLNRVVNTSSAIVGSWYLPGSPTTVTFLADGTYYNTDEANDAPGGHDGMERGTYTWNSTTKLLTATPITDTNGDAGLSSLPAGFTATIVGNEMTVPGDGGTITLRRINPVLSPLNTENDFEVDQFANYRQTSAGAPALLPGPPDDFPFWGEAYIEDTVSGTDGTLTIASQAPRTFVNDGGWGIASEYSSLTALRQSGAFPNGANYVFSRSGGSATLTYPANGAFPPAPKIVGTGENGAWSNGEYHLGSSQTLIWNAHTNYDPATLVTVLSVVDQETGAELFYESVFQGDITSYDFTGKLQPGRAYDVQLEHVKIAGSTTAGTGPFAGKLGYALYNSNTRFTMVAPADPTGPPGIVIQPVSQQPSAGSPVTLSIQTQDNDPTQTFQWFKNGVEIPGQTGNSLFIPSFDIQEHSAAYTVTVANAMGQTESQQAVVGPFVKYLFIHNGKEFRQNSGTQAAEVGGVFDARVEGVGITDTFPASTITVTKPDNTPLPLALDWDHWDAETWFPSFSAMRNTFPVGVYKIQIGGDIIPISLVGNAFPNQPVISSSAGTWVNGKLRLTATEAASAITLTTNSTSGNGWASVTVSTQADEDLLHVVANIPSNPDRFATAVIPAGLLASGQSYEVSARFDQTNESIDVSSKSWAYPAPFATKGYELLSSETFLTIEVVPDASGSSYATWLSGFFTPTQLANPAISGDDVDFDNDGIPNLLEYLFGGNPTLSNSGLQPTIGKAPGSNSLVFSYKRKLAATGVTQIIEYSTSLSSGWTPAVHGTGGVTITTSPVDAETEQVTVTIPSTAPSRFARLRASR